jgi:hypothetical protein
MNRRRFLASLLTMSSSAAALPAAAQIMPEQGIPLPFFRSRAEKIAREACEQGRPECRSDVRAQMEFERSITVIFPWAALGVAILGVLFWLRAQEKKKEAHRRAARRKHDPDTFRNLDKTQAEKEREREREEAEDGLR